MSPLDSPLTDSGTCTTKLEEYCPDDVHGVWLRPLTPLSCAMSCAAGTHQVSTAIVEHYQPPAKRARKCNTPGHNASTCGKQSSFSPSLYSHTYCLSIFPQTYFVYSLSLSFTYYLSPHFQHIPCHL